MIALNGYEELFPEVAPKDVGQREQRQVARRSATQLQYSVDSRDVVKRMLLVDKDAPLSVAILRAA